MRGHAVPDSKHKSFNVLPVGARRRGGSGFLRDAGSKATWNIECAMAIAMAIAIAMARGNKGPVHASTSTLTSPNACNSFVSQNRSALFKKGYGYYFLIFKSFSILGPDLQLLPWTPRASPASSATSPPRIGQPYEVPEPVRCCQPATPRDPW